MKDFPACKNVDPFVQFDIIIKVCMKNYNFFSFFWFHLML